MSLQDVEARYYADGWGHMAHAALGISPLDTESQARTVAQYAHEEITKLRDALQVIADGSLGDYDDLVDVARDALRTHQAERHARERRVARAISDISE